RFPLSDLQAYRSVLSADGSSLISGASRWLDAATLAGDEPYAATSATAVIPASAAPSRTSFFIDASLFPPGLVACHSHGRTRRFELRAGAGRPRAPRVVEAAEGRRASLTRRSRRMRASAPSGSFLEAGRVVPGRLVEAPFAPRRGPVRTGGAESVEPTRRGRRSVRDGAATDSATVAGDGPRSGSPLGRGGRGARRQVGRDR